ITVVAAEIPNHPETVTYVQRNLDSFELALHGWNHDDYSRWPRDRVADVLRRAKERMEDLFGVEVRVFAAPWNRWSPALKDIATKLTERPESVRNLDTRLESTYRA